MVIDAVTADVVGSKSELLWSCLPRACCSPLPSGTPQNREYSRDSLGTRRCARSSSLSPRKTAPPFFIQPSAMPASLGPSSTSSQPLQPQAATSPNGSSASSASIASSTSSAEMDVTGSPSAPQLSQLPGHFEDVAMDDLVGLIGQHSVHPSIT